MAPTVLVATWGDGVFAVGKTGSVQELRDCRAQSLTADGRGGTLAVVDGHTLRRRTAEGAWTVLTTSDCELSCCIASAGKVYVGTDDARVFLLNERSELTALPGFEQVPGRETWFAGRALVNGQLLGPPLGVRSISATADGVLLANVHVGGIPRSTDGGASFQPTIAIETDVHEVRAHPTRANIVAAAAGVGLCMSRDGGATFSVQQDGMHAAYCSAVAFVEDDVWVAAAEDHFASTSRIYRRAIDRDAPLTAVVDGLPEWLSGIVDTNCIAVSGSRVAFADRPGNLHVSPDSGRSWSRWASELGSPSSIHVAG